MDWMLYFEVGLLSILSFVALIGVFVGLLMMADAWRGWRCRRVERARLAQEAAEIHARLLALVARGWWCWWCESRQAGARTATGLCETCQGYHEDYCKQEMAG